MVSRPPRPSEMDTATPIVVFGLGRGVFHHGVLRDRSPAPGSSASRSIALDLSVGPLRPCRATAASGVHFRRVPPPSEYSMPSMDSAGRSAGGF